MARNQIWALIRGFDTGGAPSLTGPVGIAQATGEVVDQAGWMPLITLAATISMSLGILNILPIPMRRRPPRVHLRRVPAPRETHRPRKGGAGTLGGVRRDDHLRTRHHLLRYRAHLQRRNPAEMMSPRRASKPVFVGDVQVGGDAPVAVQSMCATITENVDATVAQLDQLKEAGCDIVRIAIPDKPAADAIPEIVKRAPLPIIADIHFDYRALAAIRGGFDGLRLNPGNIRDAEKVKQVAREAKEHNMPIRIGVNAGSLPPIRALAEGELPPSLPDRMVEAALWEIKVLNEADFDDIKISMKAFDVPTMVEAYRRLATLVPYPLHLGVTEAGTPRAGSVRSAIGIGILLSEGIGDTIRVSLAADPVEEVPVCWDILNTLNLRKRGATLVACPPAVASKSN
jgi:(E)-4-hydroxy-3-methylbut-2-enyl-diphosphate synthase